MGNIICVCNNKGGCGKTTCSNNLGAALARQKKKVLVVDNDNQCNATKILTGGESNFEHSIYDLYEDCINGNITDSQIEKTIVPSKHHPNLFVLPCIEAVAGLEIPISVKHPASVAFLRHSIREYVTKHFDITLIDCPPTLSIFVHNALFAADFTLVPADPECIDSIGGLQRIVTTMKDIQEMGNKELTFLRMLINGVDKRTNNGKAIILKLENTFDTNTRFKTVIPKNQPFRDAQSKRRTIFEERPTSRGAAAYRDLAKEVIKILKTKGTK